jgi:hypothetical protein
MGTAVATMTHHVAHSPHIIVNPLVSRRDLMEIFGGVERCDLLELSL